MRKFITSLLLILFVSVAAHATDTKNSSGYRIIAPIKDNGSTKDTTTTIKKKDEKSFRETILALLLKFEK